MSKVETSSGALLALDRPQTAAVQALEAERQPGVKVRSYKSARQSTRASVAGRVDRDRQRFGESGFDT